MEFSNTSTENVLFYISDREQLKKLSEVFLATYSYVCILQIALNVDLPKCYVHMHMLKPYIEKLLYANNFICFLQYCMDIIRYYVVYSINEFKWLCLDKQYQQMLLYVHYLLAV